MPGHNKMTAQEDLEHRVMEAGFRQIKPSEVRIGQQIAYIQTMFGFPYTDGYEVAWVLGVSCIDEYGDEWEIRHSGEGSPGYAEVEDEIWVRDSE